MLPRSAPTTWSCVVVVKPSRFAPATRIGQSGGNVAVGSPRKRS